MQKHILLLNRFFTASTLNVFSPDSVILGGYYGHDTSGLGGGVVNEQNVRNYLNNPDNDFIAHKFVDYLTGSTNSDDFKEIFYSDKKLSNVFNKFYQTTIVSGLQSPTSYIDDNLTGTTQISYTNNNFLFSSGTVDNSPLPGIPLSIRNASRLNNAQTKLEGFSIEDSYYVNVMLNREFYPNESLEIDFCPIINIIFSASTGYVAISANQNT